MAERTIIPVRTVIVAIHLPVLDILRSVNLVIYRNPLAFLSPRPVPLIHAFFFVLASTVRLPDARKRRRALSLAFNAVNALALAVTLEYIKPAVRISERTLAWLGGA